MPQYIIDIGATANDGTGDPLRTAFNETNLNFDQVFAAGPVLSNIQIANNTISVINTNGNLVLSTNGTGKVKVAVDLVPNNNLVQNLGSNGQRWSTVYTQFIDVSGGITATGSVRTGVFNANTVPSASTVGAGARAFVTDSTSNAWGVAYTGGGSNSVPIWSNGTNWYVG